MNFEYGCVTANKYSFLDDHQNKNKKTKAVKDSDKLSKDAKLIKNKADSIKQDKKTLQEKKENSAETVQDDKQILEEMSKQFKEGSFRLHPLKQFDFIPSNCLKEFIEQIEISNLENIDEDHRRSSGSGRGNNRSGNHHHRLRRSNDSDHHREFDRHSGSEKTGIKAVDKKDGAGKGNWGTVADELAAEEIINDVNSRKNRNWADIVDESEEIKERETNESLMTLDEFKTLKNQENKKSEFNVRRPGEGEDTSRWANTYVLPKKVIDRNVDQEKENENSLEKEKKKSLIDQIQIKFYEPESIKESQ